MDYDQELRDIVSRILDLNITLIDRVRQLESRVELLEFAYLKSVLDDTNKQEETK